MASTETLRLLVTVKAYPAIGRKHGEAVCVAGIDVDSPRWVRLYPVPFRDLPNPNRFKKYETIELQARKAATDQRPESYTPNTGSIMVVRKSLPVGKARERRAYVEPLASASMCEIRRRRETDGTSLGVFRPAELLDFEVEEDRTPWDPEKQGRVDQTSLLMPGKTALGKVPYTRVHLLIGEVVRQPRAVLAVALGRRSNLDLVQLLCEGGDPSRNLKLLRRRHPSSVPLPPDATEHTRVTLPGSAARARSHPERVGTRVSATPRCRG